jgi:hypothetical protein
MIETTTTKKAKNDLITAPLVFESANSVSLKKKFLFIYDIDTFDLETDNDLRQIRSEIFS